MLESTAHLSAVSAPPTWRPTSKPAGLPPRHPASALPSRPAESEGSGGSEYSYADSGSHHSDDEGDDFQPADLKRIRTARRANSPLLPEGDEHSDDSRELRYMRRPDAPTPMRMAHGPSGTVPYLYSRTRHSDTSFDDKHAFEPFIYSTFTV